jgi:uncharacterized protein YlxW (UPF0749 family)
MTARLLRLRWQAVMALFLTFLGFIVIAQLRSRQPIRQAADLPSWRLPELAQLVRQQETARRLLEAEVDALRKQVQEYEAAIVEGRELTEAMNRDLAQFRLVLGLVPVHGPGVRVTVAEGAQGTGTVLPPLAQAQDLSGLANELWAAGAEAIAVNGVRVLATTGIRQADLRVTLGGVTLQAPYRIEAIGDPELLRAALAIRGGFVEGLRSVGLRVEVSRQDRLILDARSTVEPFRLSRPATSP